MTPKVPAPMCRTASWIDRAGTAGLACFGRNRIEMAIFLNKERRVVVCRAVPSGLRRGRSKSRDLSCALLSGPSTMTVWTKEEKTNASQEAQARVDHRSSGSCVRWRLCSVRDDRRGYAGASRSASKLIIDDALASRALLDPEVVPDVLRTPDLLSAIRGAPLGFAVVDGSRPRHLTIGNADLHIEASTLGSSVRRSQTSSRIRSSDRV